MDLDKMKLTDVISRIKELDIEVRDATDMESIEKATAEKKNLLERQAELEAIEERKKIALELNKKEIVPDKVDETRKETPKMEIEKVELEQRGKDLKENRSVLVGATGVLLQEHQANQIKPGFNEVSSLLDRVATMNLPGGESFEQPYLASTGLGGYTDENTEYTSAEPTFGAATITKVKITAYAEFSEELEKLPAADYANVIMQGVPKAVRKKITKEILIGDGTTGHLVGIFDDGATAIDSSTDIDVAEITEDTLDNITYSYGGDEDTEDAAVLILNKLDLKAFAMLRDANGRKIYEIKTNGNTGTIDGVPYIINSVCNAVSDTTVSTGEYSMAYGPLSNYLLTVFSSLDVKRSDDFKFNVGMIAHRASVFTGGNVVAQNGFLRVKKG